jgi:hypothetical protein
MFVLCPIHTCYCFDSLFSRSSERQTRVSETIFRAARQPHRATHWSSQQLAFHTPMPHLSAEAKHRILLEFAAHDTTRSRSCTRPTTRCGRRRASRPPLVCSVGRHTALAGAGEESGHRQRTTAEQSGGQSTRACPHPRRQPFETRHQLHGLTARGAPQNRQAALHSDSASLRQGRAGSARQTYQEENSGRK